jgi:hypothetical protein
VPEPDLSAIIPAPPGASRDDAVGAMVVGTVGWLVVLIGCLVGRDWLDERGDSWWLRTAVIGVGMGVMGILFTRRRARAYRAHRLAEAREDPDGP